ncbi:MAG: hypothetical protein RR415_13485 [Ruthenibacterium sp.]
MILSYVKMKEQRMLTMTAFSEIADKVRVQTVKRLALLKCAILTYFLMGDSCVQMHSKPKVVIITYFCAEIYMKARKKAARNAVASTKASGFRQNLASKLK